MNADCVSLILASGEGSRFNGIKQLAAIDGQPMLRRVAEQQLGLVSGVVVVLGAHADKIASSLEGLDIDIVENKDWSTGMSSSIRSGVDFIQRAYASASRILIILADQPFIPTEKFEALIQKSVESEGAIVASAYNGTSGVPAVFPKQVWNALTNISGDKGARNMLRNNGSIVTIDVPEAALDIDTSADLH